MQYYAAINRSDALITGQCGRTLGDSVTGNIQNRKIWRQKVDWWLPGFVGLDRGGVNATKFFFFFFFFLEMGILRLELAQGWECT